jgi:outer membrane protein assembly factor BamB
MRPAKSDDFAVRSYTALFVIALLAGVAAAQNAPTDYPQWRGRERDGGVSAFVEPATWPESLTRRWRVNVGEGYATPVIIGNTVYAFTRIQGREGLTALDVATGAVRWRSDYEAPYSPADPAAKHGAGPKATPLFHQGRLFTLGISGIVAAFDPPSGTLLWHSKEPNEAPYFSAASSPVAADDLVVAHPGNYEPLTAFDTISGVKKWTTGTDGFFMAPTVAVIAGVRQVVTVTVKAVIGVSIPDGRLLWEYPWSGGGAGGTMPIIHHDTVIVSATGAGVTAIRITRQENRWNAERLWETKEVSMYVSNPVVIDETLFGLSQRASGQYFAIDVRDGKVLWLGPPREAQNTAVAKAGDLLFLLDDDGELIVARAARTGLVPLRRYTVADSATWAQPAISGNRFFIKDVSALTLWTLE